MKKINLLIALSLFMGIMFTACDKDEDNNEPKEKKLYPTKITEYEDGVIDDIITFEYNANKQLIKKDYGDNFYETYSYDSDGKLIEYREYYDNSLDILDSMEYNGNAQLIKIQGYNNTVKEGWFTLEYNALGNVIKKTEYGSDGALVLYFTYLYDINGNMISEKYYWAEYPSGVVSTDKYSENTYTYDNKNNIYKSLGLPFIWETNINNFLNETYTEHYGDNYTSTDTYTYIYNEDNYPTEYTEDNERILIEYQEL